MKRIMSRRSLAAVVLTVVVLLSVLGFKLATAQIPDTAERPRDALPRAQGKKGGAWGRAENWAPGMEPMAKGANRFPGMGLGMSPPGAPDPALQAEQEALAEQESETQRLVSEYGQTEDEKERTWVVGELTKVTAKHFDIRQEARDRELKHLEDQVRKLRELHQKRARQKDEIVQDRVRHLLRDVDGLGWGTEGAGEVSAPASDGDWFRAEPGPLNFKKS